jgi:nitroreductase
MKNLINKILYSARTKVIWPFIIKNSFLTAIYYFFFTREFRHEFISVLSGRIKYHHSNKSSNGNIYLLRRNIHRLEKALIMRPLKPVFALDYICQTVDNFILCKKCSEKNAANNELIKWANDVLGHYFEVVENVTIITQAYNKFKQHQVISSKDYHFPQERNFNERIIHFDEFVQLTKKRRSVRWFTCEKVSFELIEKAISAGLQSPSACNRQPFSIHIFDDKEKIKNIAELPGGTLGFSHNIPVLAVIIGHLDAFSDEKDRHVIYIDSSLFAMSFMFALETLGLSSCVINWPDVIKKELLLAKFLDLKKFEKPIMLIALGYPDKTGLVPYSAKKNMSEVVSYN